MAASESNLEPVVYVCVGRLRRQVEFQQSSRLPFIFPRYFFYSNPTPLSPPLSPPAATEGTKKRT